MVSLIESNLIENNNKRTKKKKATQHQHQVTSSAKVSEGKVKRKRKKKNIQTPKATNKLLHSSTITSQATSTLSVGNRMDEGKKTRSNLSKNSLIVAYRSCIGLTSEEISIPEQPSEQEN
eukprot:TRINITY_DN7019_c0_g1_i1.p1 TRINITY_DN7019_c0_g1~~TRINITY_DN7019_c0_g1_i1.p1  ORF type:complete len:120 (-),score=20.30 TRINITY_DN7019_c0_g1_i1:226-585(-)